MFQQHPARSSFAKSRIGLLILFVLIGCTTPQFFAFKNNDGLRTAGYTPEESSAPLKVKADSSGLAFDEKSNAAARDELRSRIDALVREERYASARAWVRRFPEVSLDILRSETEPAEDATLAVIAAGYDEQCLDGKSSAGWSEVLRNRQAGVKAYAPYAQARTELLEHLKHGRTAEAERISLPTLAKPLDPLVQIDAWHLSGTAYLLTDKTEQAADALGKGAELARRHNPHQAAEMLLLLSDAQRRAGQYDLATAHWQQSVLLGAELLQRKIPVCDPNFWERASYLRPVDQRWPQSVELQLVAASGLAIPDDANSRTNPNPADVAVWACLGRWRLDRNEPEAALATLKRAETMTADARVQEQLRLAEAQAMFRLEQAGAATAILVGLSQSANPPVASAAQALLGSMKLQAGQTQVGFNLLHKVLQTDVDWPGRAEAEADFGLAWLMLGDESQGLRWLHSAQRRFESQGDHELLAKSLFNEAEYYKASKRKQDADGPTERLLAVERHAAVVPAGLSF